MTPCAASRRPWGSIYYPGKLSSKGVHGGILQGALAMDLGDVNTLRRFLAGQAIAGLCANSQLGPDVPQDVAEKLARSAAAIADALTKKLTTYRPPSQH